MERLFRTGGSMRRSDGNRARSPQNQPPGQPPPPPAPVTSATAVSTDDDDDDDDDENSKTRPASASTSTAAQATSRSTSQTVSSTQQASTRPTAQTASSTLLSSTQQSTTPIVTSSTTQTLTASTTSVVVTTPSVSSRTTLVTSTVQSIPPKVSTFVSVWVSTVSSSAQTSATAAAGSAGISSSSPSIQAVAVGTVSAVGAVAVILTVVFFCLTRYRARKRQVPTFDVYRRFSHYYHRKSRKLSSQDAPVIPSEEPPVPPLPLNVQSQSHYENRDMVEEKPEPNGFDKMRMRIAAVQELEEMEARLREDQRAKAIAEENEKTSWNGVGEWVKNQTKRNTGTKGLERGRDKGSGDTRNSTARGTWYL